MGWRLNPMCFAFRDDPTGLRRVNIVTSMQKRVCVCGCVACTILHLAQGCSLSSSVSVTFESLKSSLQG